MIPVLVPGEILAEISEMLLLQCKERKDEPHEDLTADGRRFTQIWYWVSVTVVSPRRRSYR
jgi:hypothetical protein